MCLCIRIQNDPVKLYHTTSFLSFRPTGKSPSSFSGLQCPAVCTHTSPSIPSPSLLLLCAHQAPAMLPLTVLEPAGTCRPRASVASPPPACEHAFKHAHVSSSSHTFGSWLRCSLFRGAWTVPFWDLHVYPHLSSCLYFSPWHEHFFNIRLNTSPQRLVS